MTPIATFPTLDDAESALDWIGVDFTEGDGTFEGELSGDDWELLSTAAADADAPGPGARPRAGDARPLGSRRRGLAAVRGRLRGVNER